MKKKRRFPLISLLLVAAGAALLLYPTVSDCWNAMVQTRAIASYQERVSDLDEASYADLLEAASLYNAALLDDAARFHPDAQEHAQYTQLRRSIMALRMGCCRSRSVIWKEVRCQWVEKARIVCFPAIAACLRPGCFLIWTRCRRAMSS